MVDSVCCSSGRLCGGDGDLSLAVVCVSYMSVCNTGNWPELILPLITVLQHL